MAMESDSGSGLIRVGLISPEPIREVGLASALEDYPAISIITGNVDRVLSAPDVNCLILDLSQEAGWMGELQRVRRARPDVRLIVVGPVDNTELMVRSITAGARAYLDPNSAPSAVRHAVETVIQGYIWAPRRVMSVLIDRLLSQVTVAPARLTVAAFSPRERQVLDLITDGNSNRRIAEILGIEERTVKAYVASLFRKTGMENRVSLSLQELRNSRRERRMQES